LIYLNPVNSKFALDFVASEIIIFTIKFDFDSNSKIIELSAGNYVKFL